MDQFKNVRLLFDIPRHQLEHYSQQVCFAGKEDGKWKTYSTEEYISLFNKASRGLLKLGIQKGDKVAIISNNRPEWNIMDMALLQIGVTGVPIYPTISSKDYKYIMNDAGVKMVIVSDEELLHKVEVVKDEVETLQHIYSFNQIDRCKNWKELLHLGEDGNQDDVEAIKATISPDDMATLIYTSGTTGNPKGVILSHTNLVSNSASSTERFPLEAGEKALSFLPVCHVYERMILYLYQLKGIQVYFAESMDTIVADMQEVQPAVFSAVPRLLEKVYDKILAKGQALSGIKKALFFWAVDLGFQYEPYKKNGGWYQFKLGIARKLIFKKWQAALGGNVKIVASGSAALQPRLARIFHAAGIPIMEGYGLTETSPVIAVNMEKGGLLRIGSVGKPLRGVEVKIAEDGEILCKGPNVMQGYYKLPDKTAEVLDADGWFHTGDIGVVDEDGFLKITDRKKEIFKTSGGKYVAPQVMENAFKASRFIEQIIVVGENRKFPAALIVPAFDFCKDWAKEKGIDLGSSHEELITNEDLIQRIKKEVDGLNQDFGSWEQIKKFKLLPNELSIDNGELTPTLKPKRKVINDKYNDLICSMYPDNGM